MFESTIEETDINSSIETVDKIAGGRAVYDNTAGAIVADRDKTARAGAIHDKIAEEVVEFLAEQPIEATLNTVDPFIELVVLAADRVKETDEDTIEKIAEEASDDNTINLSIELVIQAADRVSEEAVETIVIDPITETIIDTIDPSIELAVDRVGEEADENIVEKFVINSSIEATVDNIVDSLRRYKAAKRPTKKLRDPSSNPVRVGRCRVASGA